MANVKQGLVKNEQASVAKAQPLNISSLVNSKSVQERFEKMLGKNAGAFLSSVVSICSQNKMLAVCTPQSVLSAAAIAASLNLPVHPSLGFAWIIPYKNTASFQLGVKGLIQLCLRSGQMKNVLAVPVMEGEIENWNKFTETFTPGEKKSEVVVGYYASFELVNGFTKATYWTKEQVEKHARRFSKSYGNGPWKTDFDAMAEKVVLSSLLRKYCPMSLEMQEGFVAESADFKSPDDNAAPETIEAETVEQAQDVPFADENEAGMPQADVDKLFQE